jgi:hypothetical protein
MSSSFSPSGARPGGRPSSSAKVPLAPSLDGAGGRLARSMPQLEDEASATDLQKKRSK